MTQPKYSHTKDYNGDLINKGDLVLFALEANVLAVGRVIIDCVGKDWHRVAVRSTKDETAIFDVDPSMCVKVPEAS